MKRITVKLQIILGTAIFLLSLLAFIYLRENVSGNVLSSLDNWLMTFLYLHRTPLLTTVMKAISMFGFEIPIILGVVIFIAAITSKACVVERLRKYIKEAFVFALIVGMAPIINGILKEVIQRPRPFFHPLVLESGYSFPSNHALTSFVFYITLTYFIYRLARNRKPAVISAIFFSFLVFMVGISRIYLGVHYPTDVLAGWLVGLCWLSGVFLVICRHDGQSRS